MGDLQKVNSSRSLAVIGATALGLNWRLHRFDPSVRICDSWFRLVGHVVSVTPGCGLIKLVSRFASSGASTLTRCSGESEDLSGEVAS